MTADAEFGAALVERSMQAVDDRVKPDTAVGMCLRVEKYFGVKHVVLLAVQQICPAQVEEILFLYQDISTLVINIEKGLQIAEFVGATDFVC